MDFQRTVMMWIIIILTFGLFFLFLMITSLFFLSCFISFIIGVSLFFLARWAWNFLGIGEVKVEPSKTSNEDVKERKNKKKTTFLNKFSSKKSCENCGSELVYRESYDSYYCPECHEYK